MLAYCIKYPLQCTQPDDGQLRAETCSCYSLSTNSIQLNICCVYDCRSLLSTWRIGLVFCCLLFAALLLVTLTLGITKQ